MSVLRDPLVECEDIGALHLMTCYENALEEIEPRFREEAEGARGYGWALGVDILGEHKKRIGYLGPFETIYLSREHVHAFA